MSTLYNWRFGSFLWLRQYVIYSYSNKIEMRPIIIIIIIIIIFISFMQGIYTYIPQTDYIPR